MKKYTLTEETKQIGDITLHRIQALKSFSNVEEGNLGGWIQKEENLSHEGNAWVSGDAQVYGNVPFPKKRTEKRAKNQKEIAGRE